MLLGEGLDGGHHRCFRVGQNIVGIDQERFVLVGADAPAIAMLPEVHGVILVAHHRVVDFLGCAREFRNGRSFHVLVLDGVRGMTSPTMRPMRGPQMPAQTSTLLVSMRPWSVTTACT